MLQAGFIGLTILMAAMVCIGIAQAAGATGAGVVNKRAGMITAAALAGWLIYVAVLSVNGVFLSVAMPPKVPLLLVFPTFLFIAYFFASGKFAGIIAHTPARWVVYTQCFRIVVEVLLLMAYKQGKVPVEATFEGYNYDIAAGLLALPVGWYALRNGRTNKTLLTIYNIGGLVTLAVIVGIAMTQAYYPALWHKQESIVQMGFGMFPFTYLAGFLMPLAVFMHVFSLVKTYRKAKN